MLDRNEMIEQLRKGFCTVKFKKVNGDERLMDCTLKEEYIPENHRPTTAATTYNEEVIRVYDVRADGWRSFRYDNVISFE
jgi:hypothetical protein